MTLFVLPLVVGVLLGLLCGGRLRALATIRLRRGWVVAPAMGLQLVLIYRAPTAHGVDPLRLWLPLTMLALAWFALSNWRLRGMQLMLVGLAANGAVILANGGLMPTNAAAMQRAGMAQYLALAREQPGVRIAMSKDELLPTAQTPLWPLSDTLVSPPVPTAKVMSVGDLFVLTGLAVLVMESMGVRGRPGAAAVARDVRSSAAAATGS